jgi:hypothetical protein
VLPRLVINPAPELEMKGIQRTVFNRTSQPINEVYMKVSQMDME